MKNKNSCFSRLSMATPVGAGIAGRSKEPVVVTVAAEVHSPTRITEAQVFDMSGYVDCRSVAEFELNWVGPITPVSVSHD